MYEKNVIRTETFSLGLEPSKYTVSNFVAEQILSASYRDEEDTNEYFLVAVGDIAALGLAILKDARPASLETFYESWGKGHDEPVSLWSFGTEDEVMAAFAGVSWSNRTGYLCVLRFDRKAMTAAA